MNDAPRPARPSRARRLLTGLAIGAAVFLLIEGVASTLVFMWNVKTDWQWALPERRHTEWDPELGWVNAPNASQPDLYGPGLHLTTDALGFRGTRELAPELAPGTTRIVCTGDSFTLGYGVGDEDTWPARLAALRPDVEAVNMGQGGYGVDQAWIWYERDGLALEHGVCLFAFIGDDFDRMRSDRFLGYGKPLLQVVDGELSIANVPVPKGAYARPLLTQNARLLEGLRFVELARRVARKLGGAPVSEAVELSPDESSAIATALFARLRERTAQAGVRLALVSLPTLDHTDRSRLKAMPAYAEAACQRAAEEGVEWIDLFGVFTALSDAERRALFIAPGELAFPGATGHYSAAGNEFVARVLMGRIEALGWLD